MRSARCIIGLPVLLISVTGLLACYTLDLNLFARLSQLSSLEPTDNRSNEVDNYHPGSTDVQRNELQPKASPHNGFSVAPEENPVGDPIGEQHNGELQPSQDLNDSDNNQYNIKMSPSPSYDEQQQAEVHLGQDAEQTNDPVQEELTPEPILEHDISVLNSSELIDEDCRHRARSKLPDLLDPPDSMEIALKQYSKLHREGRKCIDSKSTCISYPPMIVWETERGKSGGLGDRLVAFHNLLLLAIMTKRVFMVIWQEAPPNPYALVSALHPAYIDWNIAENNWLPIRLDETNSTIFAEVKVDRDGQLMHLVNDSKGPIEPDQEDIQKQLSSYNLVIVRNCPVLEKILTQLVRNVHAKEQLEGLSEMSLLELQRALTDFLFRPSPAVSFLVSQRIYNEPPYISVHARTGQDVYEESDGRFVGLSSQFHNISQRFLTCLERLDKGNLKRAFLASDSLVFKTIFIHKLEQAGWEVRTNKRYVWHLDKTLNVRFESPKDNCIGFLDVFADLYALAGGQTTIFFKSNFPAMSIGTGNSVKNWFILNQRTQLGADDCLPQTEISNWEDSGRGRLFLEQKLWV